MQILRKWLEKPYLIPHAGSNYLLLIIPIDYTCLPSVYQVWFLYLFNIHVVVTTICWLMPKASSWFWKPNVSVCALRAPLATYPFLSLFSAYTSSSSTVVPWKWLPSTQSHNLLLLAKMLILICPHFYSSTIYIFPSTFFYPGPLHFLYVCLISVFLSFSLCPLHFSALFA